MSSLDIAERRKPQDGKFQVKAEGRQIDFRVSTLPCVHGEKVVLRILDGGNLALSLDSLGFEEKALNDFREAINSPYGMILVTGPTGSGKTTTLYAALKRLNKPNVKIITAENPVEYNLPGVNQSEVRHNIGLDFSKILRSMLRQAPNIILVGEIRDAETAEIAIQAALTGHLVFSTLHTNDAPSALTRLLDMGVKPFLASTAVMAVMAQRLVRRLCLTCRQPVEPAPSLLAGVGLEPSDVEGRTIYQAVGCRECRFEGYKGRVGIFELFAMDPQIREITFRGGSTQEIRDQAKVSGGLRSLRQDGVRKILTGQTTIEEILRVTGTEKSEGAASM
jgi:type IV pilus assembly protein PilB